VINAQERRKVVTINIPGAFMHSDMDELVHMQMEGPFAELLARVDPEKYETYFVMEGGKKVLYVILQKALYSTLQAALLFWKNISTYLEEEMGFAMNPYDWCVVNKIINGKQCTILWHVDDINGSHVEQKVLDDIAKQLNDKYGQEMSLTVHRRMVHDYLGMVIDYSEEGKVKFSMHDYVDGLLDEAPDDMDGLAVTPAENDLFTMRGDAELLNDKRAKTFQHLMAKTLYLSKIARPDLLPTVSFLTTRVTKPNVYDWKKLSRCIKYLRNTKHLVLTLEAEENLAIKWSVDASFAVHPDMKSHWLRCIYDPR
jgi:hypothetical protein